MKGSASSLILGALLTAAQPIAAQSAASDAGPATETSIETEAPELYRPQDDLERGLWMQMDEAERRFRASPLIIHDPALNEYLRQVLCRTVGEAECRNIRLYILHTPAFNAAMAPNGVMEVWSGLLLRTQNEAQLAAVLAHEYVHFEGRHSVRLFRDARAKSAAAAWLAVTGIGLIASIGLLGSVFKYSRDMEREADLLGLDKLAAAGYDARQAAIIWEQQRAEMDATAAARGTKSRQDKSGGRVASHPPSAERGASLRSAAESTPGVPGETGADSYRAAMATWWPVFVDDQLKMNDFGATAYLLDSIAGSSGWTPWLNYARGELHRRRGNPGDADSAIGFYSQAIEEGADLPELWRGRGLALLKAGRQDEGRADLREYLARAPAAADRGLITMMSGGIE